MIWIAIGLGVAVALYLANRARRVAAVFSRATLEAVGEALPGMRERALEEGVGAFHSRRLLLVYTVRKDEDGWVHHVSASTSTRALAAGTFFLGLAREAFHLEAAKPIVFVTQRGVFHFEVVLSDAEHRAAVERDVEPTSPDGLREAGFDGRAALLPRVTRKVVPLRIPAR
jgi:hypothetical protein